MIGSAELAIVRLGFCAWEISYSSSFDGLGMLSLSLRTSTRMLASPGTRKMCVIV